MAGRFDADFTSLINRVTLRTLSGATGYENPQSAAAYGSFAFMRIFSATFFARWKRLRVPLFAHKKRRKPKRYTTLIPEHLGIVVCAALHGSTKKIKIILDIFSAN
jgi:hypothetical protein